MLYYTKLIVNIVFILFVKYAFIDTIKMFNNTHINQQYMLYNRKDT